MKQTPIPTFLRAILLLLGILFLFNLVNAIGCIVNDYKAAKHPKVEIQIDTLIIRDTVFIEKPILQTVKVIDTLQLLVPTRDTLMLHDTILLQLPIEQRRYGDSRYTAWISGYKPQLDSIQIYQTTNYITKEITRTPPTPKPRHWGLGLQAGYGVTISNSQIKTAPYIGIGLSYSIINW